MAHPRHRVLDELQIRNHSQSTACPKSSPCRSLIASMPLQILRCRNPIVKSHAAHQRPPTNVCWTPCIFSVSLPFGLFRDWQRTQTQSLVHTLRSLRPQMDVRFCSEQEPSAEKQACATDDPDQINNAFCSARKENSCFSVDKDLHGWR